MLNIKHAIFSGVNIFLLIKQECQSFFKKKGIFV
jgi:hypothetical protein